ncbi:MAG: DUF2029 domain-containing protein, partial [Candidatus Omnitrophica bacterium]|nr:DUF2029 domain-containing protein [Candidatus Omnitrophota bacterium]
IGLIVAVLFSLMLVRYLDRVPKRHYCDFRVYHHAAQDILAGKDIYFRETEDITPFKYSPFFAFIFVPFGILPIKGAAALFFTLNVILTVVLFRLALEVTGAEKRLSAVAGYAGGRGRWWLYGLSGIFLARFVILVWDSGQVNIVMCALVLAGLFMLERKQAMPAGAFLAAAILIKYTPAIFLPYLLVRREFRACAWTVAFLAVWLALPALAVGIGKEWAYLSSWIPSIVETSLDHMSYIDSKNQSLISMVIRFLSDTGYNINIAHLTFRQGQLAGYAAAAGLYALALLPPFGRKRDQSVDYALLFCFLPLFNPNSWMINFIALAVPCMLLIGRLLESRGKNGWLLACLLLSFGLTTLMAQDIVGNDLENLGELFSNVTAGTLLLVAALLILKFTPGRQGAAGASSSFRPRF